MAKETSKLNPMFIVLISIFRYLLPKHTTAITLWPFIVFKHKESKLDLVLINHERIHLRQQLELLILPFYIIYLLEFLYLLITLKNSRAAYLNISFEREAYANQEDLEYLKKRKFWGMWHSQFYSK